MNGAAHYAEAAAYLAALETEGRSLNTADRIAAAQAHATLALASAAGTVVACGDDPEGAPVPGAAAWRAELGP